MSVLMDVMRDNNFKLGLGAIDCMCLLAEQVCCWHMPRPACRGAATHWGRVWQMDSSGKLYVDSIMPPLIKRMGDSKVRTAGGLYARVCVCGCGGGCGGGCGCMCVWCTLAVEGCDDEWFRVFTPTPLRLYRPACASELWTWRCFSWGWPIPPP